MGNSCEQMNCGNGKCDYWDEENPEVGDSIAHDADGNCDADGSEYPGDVCDSYNASNGGDYCDRCGEYLGYEDEEESECHCE